MGSNPYCLSDLTSCDLGCSHDFVVFLSIIPMRQRLEVVEPTTISDWFESSWPRLAQYWNLPRRWLSLLYYRHRPPLNPLPLYLHSDHHWRSIVLLRAKYGHQVGYSNHWNKKDNNIHNLINHFSDNIITLRFAKSLLNSVNCLGVWQITSYHLYNLWYVMAN